MRLRSLMVIALGVFLSSTAVAQNQDEQDALQAKADAAEWRDWALTYRSASLNWWVYTADERNAMTFAFNAHVSGSTIPEAEYDEAESLLADANLNLGIAAFDLDNPWTWQLDSAAENIDEGSFFNGEAQESFDAGQFYVARLEWESAKNYFEAATYNCQSCDSSLANANTSLQAMEEIFLVYPPPQ